MSVFKNNSSRESMPKDVILAPLFTVIMAVVALVVNMM